MTHYTTPERTAALMSGWTGENKTRLRRKMEKLGVMQGGILSTREENNALYSYLATQTITIHAINGTRQISLPPDWQSFAPVKKVLWIHENHRDMTGGQAFEIER